MTAVAVAAALVAGLAGCATRGEPEFGSSVRHMIVGQTYDPNAPADTVAGVDGQKAAQAINTYRGGKQKAASPSPMLLMPTQQ